LSADAKLRRQAAKVAKERRSFTAKDAKVAKGIMKIKSNNERSVGGF